MKKSFSILAVRWRRARKISWGLVLGILNFSAPGFLTLMVRLLCAPCYPQEHRKRDHDVVILILAQDTANFLHNADHGEFFVADTRKVLPIGVHPQKKLLDQRVPDHAHVATMFALPKP